MDKKFFIVYILQKERETFMKSTNKTTLDEKIVIPPIKSQGIKTKIIPLIKKYVTIEKDTLWIEPFLGTGSVVFNLRPQRAILSDKNEHIISLYKNIQKGSITGESVRDFLETHSPSLLRYGEDYYKEVRKKFNETHDPLLFLFLNRSDFNGMIRFNRRGEFNVPFCKKNNRFSKAYISKISNQIKCVSNIMKGKDWKFICSNWEDAFSYANEKAYIYIDPPYIGRDTSYVGEWNSNDAIKLAEYAHKTPANVCLSMWKESPFRKNDHLFEYWSDFKWFDQSHFYHVGAREVNRNSIVEVIAIKDFHEE